jgi:hypothetical protein
MRRRAAVLVAVFALVSCAHGTNDEHGAGHTHAHLDTADGKPDRVIAGPQGGRGQFVVECGFSHVGADDPIVYPGQPGASHEHVFFGNTTTDAVSTLASLDAGDTTCDQHLDRAAYWVPALYDGAAMIEPVKSTAYYRAGLDIDPKAVQPYPSGLMMIAGNAAAQTEQPLEVVAWTCGAGIERSTLPPECPPGRNVRLILTFPDCWDGVRLDSANHIDHVAYSTGGICPSTHPVAVPQLQFSVEYAHTGPTDGLELASGGLLSGHADFMNAWDTEKLADEVSLCLHRDVVCGVTSGKISG